MKRECPECGSELKPSRTGSFWECGKNPEDCSTAIFDKSLKKLKHHHVRKKKTYRYIHNGINNE